MDDAEIYDSLVRYQQLDRRYEEALTKYREVRPPRERWERPASQGTSAPDMAGWDEGERTLQGGIESRSAELAALQDRRVGIYNRRLELMEDLEGKGDALRQRRRERYGLLLRQAQDSQGIDQAQVHDAESRASGAWLVYDRAYEGLSDKDEQWRAAEEGLVEQSRDLAGTISSLRNEQAGLRAYREWREAQPEGTPLGVSPAEDGNGGTSYRLNFKGGDGVELEGYAPGDSAVRVEHGGYSYNLTLDQQGRVTSGSRVLLRQEPTLKTPQEPTLKTPGEFTVTYDQAEYDAYRATLPEEARAEADAAWEKVVTAQTQEEYDAANAEYDALTGRLAAGLPPAPAAEGEGIGDQAVPPSGGAGPLYDDLQSAKGDRDRAAGLTFGSGAEAEQWLEIEDSSGLVHFIPLGSNPGGMDSAIARYADEAAKGRFIEITHDGRRYAILQKEGETSEEAVERFAFSAPKTSLGIDGDGRLVSYRSSDVGSQAFLLKDTSPISRSEAIDADRLKERERLGLSNYGRVLPSSDEAWRLFRDLDTAYVHGRVNTGMSFGAGADIEQWSEIEDSSGRIHFIPIDTRRPTLDDSIKAYANEAVQGQIIEITHEGRRYAILQREGETREEAIENFAYSAPVKSRGIDADGRLVKYASSQVGHQAVLMEDDYQGSRDQAIAADMISEGERLGVDTTHHAKFLAGGAVPPSGDAGPAAVPESGNAVEPATVPAFTETTVDVNQAASSPNIEAVYNNAVSKNPALAEKISLPRFVELMEQLRTPDPAQDGQGFYDPATGERTASYAGLVQRQEARRELKLAGLLPEEDVINQWIAAGARETTPGTPGEFTVTYDQAEYDAYRASLPEEARAEVDAALEKAVAAQTPEEYDAAKAEYDALTDRLDRDTVTPTPNWDGLGTHLQRIQGTHAIIRGLANGEMTLDDIPPQDRSRYESYVSFYEYTGRCPRSTKRWTRRPSTRRRCATTGANMATWA